MPQNFGVLLKHRKKRTNILDRPFSRLVNKKLVKASQAEVNLCDNIHCSSLRLSFVTTSTAAV